MTSDGQHIWTGLLKDFFFSITLCSHNAPPLLVLDLNQAQQDPRTSQELFYS